MPYPQLRHLRVPKASLHKIQYSPQFAPFREDFEILTNAYHPHHYKVRDRYANQPQDTLRWQVLTSMSIKALPKSVLREHLRRRHREAFLTALKDRGFDRTGKVLRGDSSTSLVKPLSGTFEVHVYGGLGFHLEFPTLVKEAGFVIDAIRKECIKNPEQDRSSPARYDNHQWTHGLIRSGPRSTLASGQPVPTSSS